MSAPLDARRFWNTLLALGVFTFAASLVALAIGSENVLSLLRDEAKRPLGWTILLKVRLVRVLVGLLAGGALACAGAVLQALFRNPLADPFVLGTSGGAAFGAVIGIVLLDAPALHYLIPFLAFAGALLAIAVVSAGAAGRGTLPTQSLLLIGVIANYVFTALVLFFTVTCDPLKLPRIEAWLLGDLGGGPFGIGPLTVFLAVCVGICVWMTLRLARSLDAMTLGDEQAAALGVRVGRVRWTAFLFSSLATAIAVSISGVVGFVGLILPHALRRMVGADHRLLLPACFLSGGALLILCDIPARILFAPVELPVGVVTAILGGPLFYIILRKRAT